MNNDNAWYLICAWIVGFLTFSVIWVYSFFAWGFLIGLAIGWLPALIGGFIAGVLWPVIILATIALVMLILLN